MDEELSADEQVFLAYGLIQQAAALLLSFPYARAAESLRRQIEVAYISDPSLVMGWNADKESEAKLQLLDAAAMFVETWERIKGEIASEGD